MILNLNFVFIIFSVCGKSFEADPEEETLNCECGVQNKFVPRIIGGRRAENGKHPWMAALMYKQMVTCGGTLINNRYVLTAGHCLQFDDAVHLTVHLGLDLLASEKKKRIYQIEKIIIHEEFKSFSTYDVQDIALLKLNETVKFSRYVKPICLAKEDYLYENKTAIVAGWGRRAEYGPTAKFLYETEVTTMTLEKCKQNEKVGSKITDTVLCAYQDNKDACTGDSGGPLMFETKEGILEQIGVVSWGIGCARPNIPGIYTRVSAYRQWIKSKTKDARYCKRPKVWQT